VRQNRLYLPKSHPYRFSGMPVLAEDAARRVASAYVEAGDGVRLGDQ